MFFLKNYAINKIEDNYLKETDKANPIQKTSSFSITKFQGDYYNRSKPNEAVPETNESSNPEDLSTRNAKQEPFLREPIASQPKGDIDPRWE